MNSKDKNTHHIDRLAATLALDENVSRVKGVSPARAKALDKLDIHTVRDLVTHFPRRYVDLSNVRTVGDARIGESCTIQGRVHEIKLKRPKPRLALVEIALVDETGLLMITAFRQPWLVDQINAGDMLAVAGKVEFNYGFKRMTNPFLEVIDGEAAQGVIIPMHPATEKITAAWMRRLINNALKTVRGSYDPLPLDLRLKYRLMSRGVALNCIHFPHTMDEARQARRRLAYEEVLMLQLFLMQEGAARSEGQVPTKHNIQGAHLQALQQALPFTLTNEQAQARDELLKVLAAPSVANHMILGDVGTGKTVVAAHALAVAADTRTQAALLAPTEVLAQQHAKSVGALLRAAGVAFELLTGSTSAVARADILQRLKMGETQVLIGTHALLEDDVVFANLTVAIIDEQQRFGVDQRAKLLAKGLAPDAIFLTATPIPRTLALALFGNLTLSYIKQRPHDLAQRTTRVVAKSERGIAYDAASEALARGEQVYVVCPLIGVGSEERDNAAASKSNNIDGAEEEYYPAVTIEDDGDLLGGNIAAATQEAEFLQSKIFIDYQVELLHGGMPSAEKQAVMERFRAGETQVLVATTVIEVGVDVPNATVMIIEDADRFGLSQLHQLRGRVGRGELSAQVFLVSVSKQEAAIARLSAMETTDDGYELAAYDLSLRREGDILGNRQSGASALKLVNVVRDGRIIEAAHADARVIMENDPNFEQPDHAALAREMRMLFKSEKAVIGG